jgi:hypothetical protein
MECRGFSQHCDVQQKSLHADRRCGKGDQRHEPTESGHAALQLELDRRGRIAETARVVAAGSAGVVLTQGGDTLPLPGLPGHALLNRGSPVLATAARELAQSHARISFLMPAPPSGRLVRVVALDCSAPGLDHLSAAVLLCPPGNLRGLGVLELRVLGLLIDGMVSVPAMAGVLGADAARVADALGAAVGAFSAPNLTAAAVSALRAGLRIPPQLAGAERPRNV